MQGTPQCLVDGTATVCTCKEDLCNTANAPVQKVQVIALAVAVSCRLLAALLL
jgi:hypothetical protein